VISRVADDVRRATTARVLEMSVPERIALALALGDQDLALFARMNNLDGEEALRRLRAQRQRGRTPSACAGEPG